MGNPLQVFLCHSSQDKPKVRELYQKLVSDKFDPWLDEKNLLPGQLWESVIPEIVKNSDVVIVCLSNNINNEGYLQKEIKTVLDVASEKSDETIFLIPTKLEECEVPRRLKGYQWVNLFESDGYDKLKRSLLIRDNELQKLPVAFRKKKYNKIAGEIVDENKGVKRLVHRNVFRNSPNPHSLSGVWAVSAMLFFLFIYLYFSFGPKLFTPKPNLIWDTVPAGEFVMGSNEGAPSSQPEFRLFLPSYQIARYEVTNLDYRLCVQANECQSPESTLFLDSNYDRHPIVDITWHDAQSFCEWIGGYLPSEAEWEKAATWDTEKQIKRIWPWGNIWYAGYLNSLENGVRATEEVGQFPGGAGPYGTLDLAGNAWEWTSSIFRDYPYNPNDGRESSSSEEQRVVRGGSWANVDVVARPINRSPFSPSTRSNDLGFRCANNSNP